MKKSKKKVWEWLATLDSHSIYDADWLKADLLKKTGIKGMWRGASHAQTLSAIKARGLGGTLTADRSKSLIAGFEVAGIPANQLSVTYEGKLGRGSEFRSALGAIKEAGL